MIDDKNRDKLRAAFLDEARDLLTELETSLLELEKSPDNSALIARVFRALHTIKGSGAMFGSEAIAGFTHEVETVFELVRNNIIPITQELIDLTLHARDYIRSLVEDSEYTPSNPSMSVDGMVSALRKIAGDTANTGHTKATSPPIATNPPIEIQGTSEEVTVQIHFTPPADIATRGIDPIRLIEELKQLGNCSISFALKDLPPLDELNPEQCHLSWDMRLSTQKGLNAVKDIFLFVQDDSDLKIELIENKSAQSRSIQNHAPIQLGEVLADITSKEIQKEIQKTSHEKKATADATTSLRVSSEKLDRLIDLVSELVTVQSHLSQVAIELKRAKLSSIAEAVERLTSDFRSTTMNIRMLPLESTFSKLNRVVRDLSKELGKEIELRTEGAETELDKTVIEKLNDPLMHILRNSIDHGIETPEARTATGKPRAGTVRLTAKHAGADVLVKIEDDGKGIDLDAVRAKGIERGLIPADAKLSEKELVSLIFMPGFSTAKSVTNISGRGVGMDVVKTGIESLGGSIECSSQKGHGTSIVLRLPLTLAIIEGLLVKVGDESFIIPLAIVEECIELHHSDTKKSNSRRNLVEVRGHLVPYIRVRDEFYIGGEKPKIELVVIVSIDGQRIGFVIDRVIGEHQTVIKNLGTMFKKADGVAGGTILGDGTVALILDVAKLKQKVEIEEEEYSYELVQ